MNFEEGGGVRCEHVMEFEVTQWEAWGGGASKEVVLEEDREDDTGEFFYVSWASVAESGGGFLAYSTGVGDRSQVSGKGKSRVFRERVRGGCLVWGES